MTGVTVQPEGAGLTVQPEGAGDVWDTYVGAHPDATVDHLWAWRGVFRDVFGHESVYLTARHEGRTVGALPLVLFRSRLFGRSVVSVPFLNYGGVLADDPAATRALLAEARHVASDFRASHVELRHTRRHDPALPYRQHKVALSRALPASVDELWRETDRKVRNQVRKAQKEELVALSGGRELVDEFYPVFAENMRDLGTPVYSKRLFVAVLERLGAQARVYLVRGAGRAMAAAVALRFRDTLLVPWASSLRRFRSLCPNTLLYWAMLEDAVANGVTTFDFGRSTPGGGTHQFKLQWGAEARPLFWEYLLLTRPAVPDQGPTNPKFDAAVGLWKHCPLWLANAIGPSIVRGIP